MKQITIEGFRLAIFKVDNALHVTVLSVDTWATVNHKKFKNTVLPSLNLYNEFSTTFDKLPEEWKERMVLNNTNKEIKSLIIIIK